MNKEPLKTQEEYNKEYAERVKKGDKGLGFPFRLMNEDEYIANLKVESETPEN
jgi:hypothetical protein